MSINRVILPLALAIAASACVSTPVAPSEAAPNQARYAGTNYIVSVQWGGETAAWRPEGVWRIGDRPTQAVTTVRAERQANSYDLVGTAIYAGEGPIGFRARWIRGNEYQVEYQWGGVDAPWNPGGVWRLGGRENQRIAAVDVTSPDLGAQLVGQVQYVGEGPIGFRAVAQP